MKIAKRIKILWLYLWGNLFALFCYDKKYLSGKYFCGRYKGLFSPGWNWVASDGAARILLW